MDDLNVRILGPTAPFLISAALRHVLALICPAFHFPVYSIPVTVMVETISAVSSPFSLPGWLPLLHTGTQMPHS